MEKEVVAIAKAIVYITKQKLSTENMNKSSCKQTHEQSHMYARLNCSSNHSCNDDEITRSVYTLDMNMCSVSLRDETNAPQYTFVQIMKRMKKNKTYTFYLFTENVL